MNVKLINNYQDFLSLECIWNRLLENSGSDHIHCTFEWLSTWWRHFGENKELFIIVAEEHNEIIGVAPLMIHKVGKLYKGFMKFRTVSFIGYGFADSADFLITRDRKEVIREFFNYVYAKEKRWDEVRLVQLSDTSPSLNIIKEEITKNKYDVEMDVLIGCPYLEIEGCFEDYYEGINKNWRYDIQRNIRRLKKDNGNLEFVVIKNVDESQLEDIYKLNKKRFDLTGHRSPFLDGNKLDFIRDIRKLFNERGWWHLFLLKFKDGLIGYQICFDYNRTISFWNTSYDLDYGKFSVGKILVKLVLEYCFEKKYKIYDFMAGDEDYKFKWTKSYRNNYQIIIRKRNLKTKVSLAYAKARSHIKRSQQAQ